MDNSQLSEYINSLDGELEIKQGKQYLEVLVPGQRLHSLASGLRSDENTLFDFLFCLSGVDYGTDLGVTYHLRSTKHGHSLVLKVRTPDRQNPVFDSVTDIWKTAELHEREAYDLLGIKFNGHPDLRRLFLDKSWGYPLRKDFTDDINIVSR